MKETHGIQEIKNWFGISGIGERQWADRRTEPDSPDIAGEKQTGFPDMASKGKKRFLFLDEKSCNLGVPHRNTLSVPIRPAPYEIPDER